MKAVLYTSDALRALKRHQNMAPRLRRALTAYAADPTLHANNLTQLVGQSTKRMRVGDFRLVFEETETELWVTRIGPRGDVYR